MNFNSFNYLVFSPFFYIISVLCLVVCLIWFIKTRKVAALITSILLTLISYNAIPYCFYVGSQFAQTPPQKFDNYKMAIKTSVLPFQKGLLYGYMGNEYVIFGDGKDAISCYENAYKYSKAYNKEWAPVALNVYIANGDYKKAIDIAASRGYTETLAKIYILKNDYKMALAFANKAVEKHPNSSNCYLLRAIILKNLNSFALADRDYQQAKKLVKTKKSLAKIEKYYQNYRTSIQDENEEMRAKLKL